jgi:tRNA(Ile2) C34 agmatinyltransferase TiaS
MKCPKCGGKMVLDGKSGSIKCPTCSKIKRELKVSKHQHNDLTYYKVKNAVNVVTESVFLLPEEIQTFINEGVVVKIK